MYYKNRQILKEKDVSKCKVSITDLILAVVQLLRRDINGLVKTVREALEPIEL